MGKYIKICKKCQKKMITDNPNQQNHLKCRSPKHKYPRKFYYQRNNVYTRDQLICQNCHKKVNNESKNPPIHHIDGNPKNNDLSNLVLLCDTCHLKINRGKDFVVYGKRKLKPRVYDPIIYKYKPLKKKIPKLFKNI